MLSVAVEGRAETLSLTVRYPSGTQASRVAVSGTEGVRINDRAQVRVYGGGPAIVANSAWGELNIGVDARVGSLFGAARVVLRDRAFVDGSVFSASEIETNAGVAVTGGLHDYASVQFADETLLHEYSPSMSTQDA